MRLLKTKRKELKDFGLILSCEACHAAFDTRYDDLEKAGNESRCYGMGTWCVYVEPEKYASCREQGKRDKQRCLDHTYFAYCPNCHTKVFIDFISIPDYIRSFVTFYSAP